MFFRQLFDRETSTYTYLLADEETREAILIDPVREQLERDVHLLLELDFTLVHTVETHVHADHVTSAGVLRDRFGCRTVISSVAGARCADVMVEDGDIVRFGKEELEVRTTPGHTDGCVSYVHHKSGRVFTGDTLLIRGCGRTDFQQGDAATLYRSIHEKLFTLPDETLVFPGHDYRGRTMSSIGEEKKHNPRLGGGRSVEEFTAIMEGLNLAHPKKIAEALPANLACGFSGDAPAAEPTAPAEPEPTWAPLMRTPEGLSEVSHEWVAQSGDAVRLIDVRGRMEAEGELGMIASAELVPLQILVSAAHGWDREAPIVTICRSGARSLSAAATLEQMGFKKVASMRGGMMAYRASERASAKGARARLS